MPDRSITPWKATGISNALYAIRTFEFFAQLRSNSTGSHIIGSDSEGAKTAANRGHIESHEHDEQTVSTQCLVRRRLER